MQHNQLDRDIIVPKSPLLIGKQDRIHPINQALYNRRDTGIYRVWVPSVPDKLDQPVVLVSGIKIYHMVKKTVRGGQEKQLVAGFKGYDCDIRNTIIIRGKACVCARTLT